MQPDHPVLDRRVERRLHACVPRLDVGEQQPFSLGELARIEVVRREGVRQQLGHRGHLLGAEQPRSPLDRGGQSSAVGQQHTRHGAGQLGLAAGEADERLWLVSEAGGAQHLGHSQPQPRQCDEPVVDALAVLQDAIAAHLDAAGPVLGVDHVDARRPDDELVEVDAVVRIGAPAQVVKMLETVWC